MSRERAERGFTLIEIMVSMALLVIGLLGVIALHATTVKGNRMSRELERARVFATQTMEDLRGRSMTDVESIATAGLPDVTTGDGVTYRRDITVTGVSGGLRMITVTVEFYENDDASDVHEAKLQMIRTTAETL